MDKTSQPRSIRFHIADELKIEEIALAENQEFAEIVRMLIKIGLHEYDFIKKNFSIAPRYKNE